MKMKSFFLPFVIVFSFITGSAWGQKVAYDKDKDEYVFKKIIKVNVDERREKRTEANFILPRKKLEDPLAKIFSIKKELHCNTVCSDVKRIVKELGLNVPTQYNPKLVFRDGDIAFYSESGLSLEDLIYELTSRKLALQSLEKIERTLALPKDTVKWQGELSALADEFQEVIDMNGKFKALAAQYADDCIPGQPVISFTINEDRTCILVDKFRIDEAQNKVKELLGDESIKFSSWTDGKEIADKFSLGEKMGCNEHLRPDRGDFQYFLENDHSTEDLILRFAGRKVILDAAREDNEGCIRVNTPGALDYAVETFIIPLIKP